MGNALNASQRLYKYDNVKAILIFLVVIGHMTSDYVSDSYLVRWATLWIYVFHMPAFVFISGLVHKQYITKEQAGLGRKGETRMRWDKVLGFFLCGYALKVFLQITRTLMGQNPFWSWIKEPGIPWYLFVMAAYEIIFFLMRYLDRKVKPLFIILGAFALSASAGYFSWIGDEFCLSRMINFLPIYALGYYADMHDFLKLIQRLWIKIAAGVVLLASLIVCRLGPFGMYSFRKWFTGRRTYEFMDQFFPNAEPLGWLYRLGVWAVALLIALSLIALIPNKKMGFITTIGARTLNVYFWHRPLCYLFRTWAVLPQLYMLFGGTYRAEVAGVKRGLAFHDAGWPMIASFLVYLLIGAAMTALFSLKVFEHPCSDIMRFAAWVTKPRTKKQQSN